MLVQRPDLLAMKLPRLETRSNCFREQGQFLGNIIQRKPHTAPVASWLAVKHSENTFSQVDGMLEGLEEF